MHVCVCVSLLLVHFILLNVRHETKEIIRRSQFVCVRLESSFQSTLHSSSNCFVLWCFIHSTSNAVCVLLFSYEFKCAITIRRIMLLFLCMSVFAYSQPVSQSILQHSCLDARHCLHHRYYRYCCQSMDYTIHFLRGTHSQCTCIAVY